MNRLEGSVPLKFNGVVIGRAHIMKHDERGITANLFINDNPGMIEAIIALVEVGTMPSMSFAFDEPTERVNDCADLPTE